MITSEDIAILVRRELVNALPNATISWQRHDYGEGQEIVIVPHMATGEASIRRAVVKVNIHVPDIYYPTEKSYETDIKTLNNLKKQVSDILKRHHEIGTGINWQVTSLDPPIKEPDYNEHFVSLNIEAYIRVRS